MVLGLIPSKWGGVGLSKAFQIMAAREQGRVEGREDVGRERIRQTDRQREPASWLSPFSLYPTPPLAYEAGSLANTLPYLLHPNVSDHSPPAKGMPGVEALRRQ